MGQKINPVGIRIGINKTWKSNWYADKKKYREQVLEDHKVRGFLNEKLDSAGIETINISRSLNSIEVEIKVARPGVVIGRGGEGIEDIKKELNKMLKTKVDFKVKEIANPDTSAKIIARTIAEAMRRGLKHRVLMSKEVEKAMTAGAKGIKIWVAGDFASPKHSRVDKVSQGYVPLQTLRTDVDYAEATTKIKNAGNHGIKVWVNHGEKTDYDIEESTLSSSTDQTQTENN